MGTTNTVATGAMRDMPERQGYSVDECAYMIGCGRTKVFDLIKEGRIRVVKIGVESVTLEYLDGRGRQTIPMRG